MTHFLVANATTGELIRWGWCRPVAVAMQNSEPNENAIEIDVAAMEAIRTASNNHEPWPYIIDPVTQLLLSTTGPFSAAHSVVGEFAGEATADGALAATPGVTCDFVSGVE